MLYVALNLFVILKYLKRMSEQCLIQSRSDNLLNLSDITEGTNFIFLKGKQEVLYIDLSGVTQAMLTV